MTRPALLALLTPLLLLPALSCTTEQPEPQIEDPPYGTHEEIIRLAVTPTHVNFGNGDRQELSAVLEYVGGGEKDVTGQVDWVVVDQAVATVDGVDAVGEGVGWTQIYATLNQWTSNVVTVEVGHFSYSVECLCAPTVSAKQAEIVECKVDVEGRELDAAHPEYVTFTIEGFIPFGHDRASLGLDSTSYFWVEDENTFAALFIIPPSLPVGEHAVTFTVEGVPGEGDEFVGISEQGLPQKTCGDLQAQGILGTFDERKYRVLFDHSQRAHKITSEAGLNSLVDTALWLFDDQGDLFTWTDNPRVGGTDAELPFGITEDLEGEYFLMLTASPYAATPDQEIGSFELHCEEEYVEGSALAGDKEQSIPHGGQTETFEMTVNLGAQDLIDGAWVHVDLESDVPSQVAITLESPALAVGLRSTGYDADRMAVTWGALVPPDQYSMTDFVGTSPNGTWTLSVTDHSTNGTTVMHNWELSIDSSPP